MRSRIAIIAMLVLGFAFSGAGVGLAISGPSTPAVTSQQGQYDDTDTNQVLGDVQGGGNDDQGTPTTEDTTGEVENDVEGGGGNVQNESGAGTPSAAEQTTAESGSTLPFTGFAAIPVVLAGVALLAGGLVLRRRTTTD